MKLLLLAILGMVAVAAAQDAGEFEVLDEGSDENDINPDDIKKLESRGTPRLYMAKMTSRASVSASLKDTCSGVQDDERPPGYTAALGNSTVAMFSKVQLNNEEVDDGESANTTSSPPALSRKGRQTPTNLYFCPHRNLLLRWFPIHFGSTLTDICFVPWPQLQAITYAQCTNTRCALRFGLGRCRPSCYRRRRILVYCYNIRRQRWYWRWVIRNLPEACRCSSC